MNKQKSEDYCLVSANSLCEGGVMTVAGKHVVDISFIYNRDSWELTIFVSNPIPSSQYGYLKLMIETIDGVGKCCVEHHYKLVCDVNVLHFDLDTIIRVITEFLDRFFRELSDTLPSKEQGSGGADEQGSG